MGLYKRSGVYWYELVYGGRRYRKSTGLKNHRATGDIAAAFRTALAKGDVGITERRRKVPTFKAAMANFLNWSKQEHQMAPSTAERYRYSSFALLSFFGDKPLDKITPDEVERYKTSRSAEYKTVRGKDKNRIPTNQRLRPATVNRELACLRAMFNHAIKGDVSLRNPISKTAAKVFREDNEQTRVLTYDEQGKYLTKATPMLRDVAMLMLETGMRPEEVYRIQPSNVYLAENYLFNPYGKTKAAKRRIKLTETAKSTLTLRMTSAAERAAKDKDSGAFLFPCETQRGHSPESKAHTHGHCAKAKWLTFAPTIVAILGLPGQSKQESTS